MTSNIKIKKINSEISSIIIDEQKTYNSLSFKNLKDLLDALKKVDKDKRVKVINGDRTRVRKLKLNPGDLQIFKGRFTLHRVTKIEGNLSRYMCIPASVSYTHLTLPTKRIV